MAGLIPQVCRVAIADLLLTVPNIGQVHRQRRQLKDEVTVRRLLGHQDKLRGWFIHPALAATTVTTRHPGHRGIGVQTPQTQDQAVFQWGIEGYVGVIDADDSEQVAMDLAWTVCETFNSYAVIPGITGAHFQLPTDVEGFKYALLAGSFLCHYIQITTGFQGRIRT